MKRAKKTDPLVEALSAANTANRVRARRAIISRSWRNLVETGREERARENAWAGIHRAICRHLRQKASIGLLGGASMEFRPPSQSVIATTGRVVCHVRYIVYYAGMRWERCFAPTCIEDVTIEGWLLWSALDAWKRTPLGGPRGRRHIAEGARSLCDRVYVREGECCFIDRLKVTPSERSALNDRGGVEC